MLLILNGYGKESFLLKLEAQVLDKEEEILGVASLQCWVERHLMIAYINAMRINLIITDRDYQLILGW